MPRRARIFAVSSEEEQHVSQPEVDRSRSGERQNSRKESQNTLDPKSTEVGSGKVKQDRSLIAIRCNTIMRRGHIVRNIGFSENLKFIIIKITLSLSKLLYHYQNYFIIIKITLSLSKLLYHCQNYFIIVKIISSQRTCLFLFLLPDKALYPLFLLVFFCFPDFYTGLFLRLQ